MGDSIDNELNRMMDEESRYNVLMAEVYDFSGLYELLREIKQVPGSKKIFSSEELIVIIELLRNGDPAAELKDITRTYGLREKVCELIEKERS